MINGLSLLCLFGAALFLIWLGMLIERDWSAKPETDYEAIRLAATERERQEAEMRKEEDTALPQSLLELEVEIQFAEVEG